MKMFELSLDFFFYLEIIANKIFESSEDGNTFQPKKCTMLYIGLATSHT